MPRLEIINDTEFNAAHSVMSDDLIYREMNDVAEVYVLPQEGSDIRILKKIFGVRKMRLACTLKF